MLHDDGAIAQLRESHKTDSISVCARTLSPPARMIRCPCRAHTLPLALAVIIALTACRPFLHRQVSGRVLAIEGVAQGMIDGLTVALTSVAARIPTPEEPASAWLCSMLK